MLIQQQSPTTIGFPLVFINFTILVFKPIAPIDIVMKNLPISDIDFVVEELRLKTVLITAANKKNKINHGNIFDKFTVVAAFFLERYKANIKVIGIIARVRVSLTMVA